jgi:hypothetical protein
VPLVCEDAESDGETGSDTTESQAAGAIMINRESFKVRVENISGKDKGAG